MDFSLTLQSSDCDPDYAPRLTLAEDITTYRYSLRHSIFGQHDQYDRCCEGKASLTACFEPEGRM
jgi:hypothetical protein